LGRDRTTLTGLMTVETTAAGVFSLMARLAAEPEVLP
jgi:hypothetical protein